VGNLLIDSAVAASRAEEPSVHDVMEAVSAGALLYVLVALMGGVIVWFIVRDRNSIAGQLQELNRKFDKFMIRMTEDFATKAALDRVDDRLTKHLEHAAYKGSTDRRAVEDSEGG